MLFLLNRADLPTMQLLEQELGRARLAWVVELHHRPTDEVIAHLREIRAAGCMLDAAQMSRELIAQRVRDLLHSGRHVVLLPPAEADRVEPPHPPASLTQLSESLRLPMQALRSGQRQGAAGAESVLRFLPRQLPGEGVGLRVQMQWAEAAAEAAAQAWHALPESPGEALLHALLEHPDAVLTDGVDDSSTRYRDLLAPALVLRRDLSRLSPRGRLGIVLPPGRWAVVAHAACALCGIEAVNVDYTASAEELRRIMQSAGLTRLITEQRFVQKQNRFAWPRQRDLIFIDELLSDQGGRLRLWRALLRFLPRPQLLRLLRLPSRGEEATLRFTRGTTGKPKAVPVSQQALTAALRSAQELLRLRPGEPVLCAQPLHEPGGLLFSLLLPLLAGCRLITYPDPQAAKRLRTLIRRGSVRVVALPPRRMAELLRGAERDAFAGLRLCLTTGDRLPRRLAAQAAREHGLQLSEAYGLTEATPLVAVDLRPAQAGAEPPHARGLQPAPGIALRITDPYREHELSAPQQPGLVWIKGAMVAPAYADDEEANRERHRGAWFCTGDVGHLNAEGRLVIDARKIRFSQVEGEPVPHEELEDLLLKIFKADPNAPQRQLAVVAVPDRARGERLVLLSALHKTVHPNETVSLRYSIMNEGRPSQWQLQMIVPVPYIPTLPGGQLNYPLCYEWACRAAEAQR